MTCYQADGVGVGVIWSFCSVYDMLHRLDFKQPASFHMQVLYLEFGLWQDEDNKAKVI